MGKREIAHYEQFLLFPLCFQKTYTADTYKPGLVWERVKELRFPIFSILLISREVHNPRTFSIQFYFSAQSNICKYGLQWSIMSNNASFETICKGLLKEGLENPYLLILQCTLTIQREKNQSVENAGVAFVKETIERDEFFEKINKQ